MGRCDASLQTGRPWLMLLVVLSSYVVATATAYDYYVGYNAYWASYATTSKEQQDVHAVLAGAQKLGLKVMRSWAFNSKLPYGYGKYDEEQFKALDYAVATAPRYGTRLILCVGNFWSAGNLVGPEDFLEWAEGTANRRTIVDFYSSVPTRVLYKKHIDTILNRKNSITGVAYKDDPTIMGWDVINEPRCPGCTAAQKAAKHHWMEEMSTHLRKLAPKQLVFAGTEGFLSGKDLAFNPGAGALCEGEDWMAESSIGSIQVATAHLYERQIEGQRFLNWGKLDVGQYLNFLAQKIDKLNDLATKLGKPWVAEEYGITSQVWGEEEQKMVFAVVLEKLIESKKANKPFIGALFWNAAVGDQQNWDGYNVYMRAAKPGFNIGSKVTAPKKGSSGRRLQLAAQLEAGAARHMQAATRTLASASAAEEALSAFHNGPARAACAHAAASWWNMALPTNLVDVEHYRQLVAGHDIVDIIAAAAKVINGA